MAATRTVTALTSPRKDPHQRVVVKVAGRSVARLSWDSVNRLGLRLDMPWDKDLAGRVREAQNYDDAMRAAMARLNRRALTRRKLHQQLSQLGHSDAVVQRVTDRLGELGLLNDEALARQWVQQASARGDAGPRLLRAKLIQQGLDRELADRLVNPSPTDTLTQATALARRRLATLGHLPPLARKQRLWGLLARRGFDTDTIEQVMADLGDLAVLENPENDDVEPG